jgi:hypothetical protein
MLSSLDEHFSQVGTDGMAGMYYLTYAQNPAFSEAAC